MEKLKHVALIVDGNGRWATEKGKTRSEGHLAGTKMLEKIIFYTSKNTDIEVLSAYIFSTENFKREKKEVDYLMALFTKWFDKARKKYKEENIKIVFSGRKEPLSDKIYSKMKKLEEETRKNTGLIVNLCLNYGGRAEIIDTTKKIAEKIKNNELKIEDITENYFKENTYNNLPDIDLMIRTSGEQRLSNFMLWQNSYAEFIFEKTYFPDFDEKKFQTCIETYYKRDRRFGGVKKQN